MATLSPATANSLNAADVESAVPSVPSAETISLAKLFALAPDLQASAATLMSHLARARIDNDEWAIELLERELTRLFLPRDASDTETFEDVIGDRTAFSMDSDCDEFARDAKSRQG